VDVLWHLLKDDQYRDNPPNPKFKSGDPPHHALLPLYTTDLPEIHDVIAEMRRVLDEFPNRVVIGEIYLPIERLVRYYGRDLTGVHLPFNFSLLATSWNARDVAALISDYEAFLPPGGWPNWVLGNHDRPRIASRIGTPQARIAAILLLTLRGTPTIYYGDEIGMTDVLVPAHQVQDPFERNVPAQGLGRDGCRSPMQWDSMRYSGFSTVEPWLPVAAGSRCKNVSNQRTDPTSLYHLYRTLIGLRRSHGALRTGHYASVTVQRGLLLYVRELQKERILVALNFSDDPESLIMPAEFERGNVILSSNLDRVGEPINGTLSLRPNEGLVVLL